MAGVTMSTWCTSPRSESRRKRKVNPHHHRRANDSAVEIKPEPRKRKDIPATLELSFPTSCLARVFVFCLATSCDALHLFRLSVQLAYRSPGLSRIVSILLASVFLVPTDSMRNQDWVGAY